MTPFDYETWLPILDEPITEAEVDVFYAQWNSRDEQYPIGVPHLVASIKLLRERCDAAQAEAANWEGLYEREREDPQ